MALMNVEGWNEAIGTGKFSNQSVDNWCRHDWRKLIGGGTLFLRLPFRNAIETAPSAIRPGHVALDLGLGVPKESQTSVS